MKRILVICSIVISIAGYFVWDFFKPTGKQKVDYTPAKKECFPFKELGEYCIYTAESGTNGGIAYHFHGKGMTANVWNDDTYYTAMIQKYWDRQHLKPPIVVSVSFGSIWILARGLAETLKDELIPEVEARTGKPRYRMVIGESMGGVNSLIAGLKFRDIFNRVITLCPVIYKQSPFNMDIPSFLSRTGADPKLIRSLMTLSKNYVSNEAEWKTVSPIELLDAPQTSTRPVPKPEIYISCGLYDKYGNFEGSEYFAEKAAAQGFKVTWHPMYGSHCAIDVPSVAEWMVMR